MGELFNGLLTAMSATPGHLVALAAAAVATGPLKVPRVPQAKVTMDFVCGYWWGNGVFTAAQVAFSFGPNLALLEEVRAFLLGHGFSPGNVYKLGERNYLLSYGQAADKERFLGLLLQRPAPFSLKAKKVLGLETAWAPQGAGFPELTAITPQFVAGLVAADGSGTASVGLASRSFWAVILGLGLSQSVRASATVEDLKALAGLFAGATVQKGSKGGMNVSWSNQFAMQGFLGYLQRGGGMPECQRLQQLNLLAELLELTAGVTLAEKPQAYLSRVAELALAMPTSTGKRSALAVAYFLAMRDGMPYEEWQAVRRREFGKGRAPSIFWPPQPEQDS